MKRVFSGVQPTGDLHLGNYLGAIAQFVQLQQDADCMFCIVDMHAITVKHDPALLRRHTLEIAAAYIACGIDPTRSTIFVQSQVPAHAELSWILQNVARMGWLERMTQFREKTGTVPPPNLRDSLKRVKSSLEGSLVTADVRPDAEMIIGSLDLLTLYEMVAGKASNVEKASVGLFTYPVLMAADILAYKATHVPVGADQTQHLNLARDIAQKFNKDYKPIFPIPEAMLGSTGARVMSLYDGTRKMSKSDPDQNSRINLSDTPEMIARKIRKATADVLPFPSTVEEIIKPEIANLIDIYVAVTKEPDQNPAECRANVLNTFGGKGYSTFKEKLTEVLVAKIEPISSEMARLLEDTTYLMGILRNGSETASERANLVLSEAKEAIGFLN